VAVEIHPAVKDADDVNAAIDRTEDYHLRPRVIFPVAFPDVIARLSAFHKAADQDFIDAQSALEGCLCRLSIPPKRRFGATNADLLCRLTPASSQGPMMVNPDMVNFPAPYLFLVQTCAHKCVVATQTRAACPHSDVDKPL
jgi:hypothetical protein